MTQPAGRNRDIYVVEQGGGRARRRPKGKTRLPRRLRRDLLRRRAGAALGRLPARLRRPGRSTSTTPTPTATRASSSTAPPTAASQRRPGRRASCSRSTSPTRTTTAASCSSAPTACSTSAWATAARAATRAQRPGPDAPARQDPAHRVRPPAAGSRTDPRRQPLRRRAAGAGPRSTALGLRNPWRFSFDRETGDLRDRRRRPGQLEEVDLRRAARPPAPTSAGARSRATERYNDDEQAPDADRRRRSPTRPTTATTARSPAATSSATPRSRASTAVPLRRLLRRRAAQLHREPGAPAADDRELGLEVPSSRASARTPPATSTRSRSKGPSTASNRLRAVSRRRRGATLTR